MTSHEEYMSIRTPLILIALRRGITCINLFIMSFAGQPECHNPRKTDKEYEQAKKDRTCQTRESLDEGLI
jgi:hypothetical protein